MISLDIRIMGVPDRMKNIRKLQKKLSIPNENIFIDTEFDGCRATAMRAWSKETDRSHVLLLQDDVELCKNFLKYCYAIVKKHPDAVISLFPFRFRSYKELKKYPSTPYVETDMVSGQGIIMRSDYIKPCLKSWKKEIIGDDTNVQEWALANDIKIITTIPAILQHIGDDSVFNSSRSVGRTKFYDSNPVKTNWGSDILLLQKDIR